MKFACPSCQGRIEASEEHFGIQAQCPHCEYLLTVPSCETPPVPFRNVSGGSTHEADVSGVSEGFSHDKNSIDELPKVDSSGLTDLPSSGGNDSAAEILEEKEHTAQTVAKIWEPAGFRARVLKIVGVTTDLALNARPMISSIRTLSPVRISIAVCALITTAVLVFHSAGDEWLAAARGNPYQNNQIHVLRPKLRAAIPHRWRLDRTYVSKDFDFEKVVFVGAPEWSSSGEVVTFSIYGSEQAHTMVGNREPGSWEFTRVRRLIGAKGQAIEVFKGDYQLCWRLEDKLARTIAEIIWTGREPLESTKKVEPLEALICRQFEFRQHTSQHCMVNELALMGRPTRVRTLREVVPLGAKLSSSISDYLGPEDNEVSRQLPGIVGVRSFSKLPPPLNCLRTVDFHVDRGGTVQIAILYGLTSETSAIAFLQDVFDQSRWPEIAPGQFLEPTRKHLLLVSPNSNGNGELITAIHTQEYTRLLRSLDRR